VIVILANIDQYRQSPKYIYLFLDQRSRSYSYSDHYYSFT